MGNPFNGNQNISEKTKQLKTLANSSPSDIGNALFGNGSDVDVIPQDKRTNSLNDQNYLDGYNNADSSGNLLMDKLKNIEKLMSIAGDPLNFITIKKPIDRSVALNDTQNPLDHDTFLFKNFAAKTDNADFLFEDPLNVGFLLSIDSDSQLLRTNGDDNIINFLNTYSNIPEISKRIPILNEFKKTLLKIFYVFTRDIVWDYSKAIQKAYYLTKIEGLDKLMVKIVNYGVKDSKLTITLTEDVSMLATYLSELYNNLTFSYKNNRYMIPDNLLRFNLRILLRDQRSFISGRDEKGYGKFLTPSYILLNLFDCNFDFSNSKSYPNAIEIGGFGKTAKGFDTELAFDIYYKSVERIIDPQLIKDAFKISSKSNEYIPSADDDAIFQRDALKFQEFKKKNDDLINLKNSLKGSTLGRTIRNKTSSLFLNLKNFWHLKKLAFLFWYLR